MTYSMDEIEAMVRHWFPDHTYTRSNLENNMLWERQKKINKLMMEGDGC